MKALNIVIASAIITATALKAVPALAEPVGAQSETATSYVRTADLDLQSDAGRRQLDRRLVIAARDVCGTASNVDLEGKNEVRQCIDDVLVKARGEGRQLAATKNGIIAVSASR